ncbi:redox-regulated ATPase YchF [Candidatus Woesebacteria bacterium CG22_combo_CG10-13_8_21_14_all_39_10]|uniref:Redox-regulated ATPase YchF n=2 Tax=Candidatus Woeseibacteriota TaxID=1752722 RepID=A0A2M7X9R4_9BACT|nr:MAG: redox-regulated ATPase YchF [Candidatus Woesebacteria bacterium CG22_combo_CG10-13_8_21_14_all_39_10]PJA42902.1 MAG: redox-regulated ATPase YchF [Candidatus Woesebacteria bacterium CG_4_9_14_3_um_filter_39_10]
MSLSVGIVGLPNAGKSTLFNALASRRLAETAPRPFTTIDPHEAVVPLPDTKLQRLSELVKPEKTVPATVTFIDIAGLVKGASHGEGLGNQFLGKIREVDAVVHVVREFSDPQVIHVAGKIDPKEDLEIVNLELELGGIVGKPMLVVYNVDEKNVNKKGEELYLCAKLEEELMDLSSEERKAYLRELGISQSGLEKLIKKAYDLLQLITFYTIKGGKEVHAWSLKDGKTAFDAAAEVHTDFAKNFIKAEVINVDELLSVGRLAPRSLGGGVWKEAKEKGVVRLEGRDYIIKNGDVVEFKIGS